MKGFRKPPVDPANVVIDAHVRLPASQVFEDFKVRSPLEGNPANKAPVVLVIDYGFTKMVFSRRDNSVHFMCKLKDWPQLVEGLNNWLATCQVQRYNAINLHTVLFTPSEWCEEVRNAAASMPLDGIGWDVMTNRFRHYAL